jgi:flagellar hook-length control protein FliK
VYGVTSDAAANLSFQTAPPKPARADQPAGNDRFGALVDSSLPVDIGHGPAAQPQSAPQRRADDAAATADNTRPRDASADQTAKNASDDANAKRPSGANAAGGANPDAIQNAKAKSRAQKGADAKSTDKKSSDAASAVDPAAPAQQADPSVTTANAFAVAIPVTAPTESSAATPAPGNATAPLAIAAAAIAVSASATAAAPAAASTQAKIAADAAIAATASAAGTAPAVAAASTAAAAASAKSAVQAPASDAVVPPVKQAATQTTDSALTAAIAATAPVPPKTTLLKGPVAAEAKPAASGAAATASGTSDSTATSTPAAPAQNGVAPQPAATGKQQAGNDLIPAKADASESASPASAAAVTGHDHSPAAATAHNLANAADTGVQPPNTIQPPLPSAAAPAAPLASLNVTAAGNAPVPLSGVALEIAASARSGKSRFEIRLDPADLGRIDVRIDVDRNGQVTSHLTVEKPETLSMLRQDAPQLQRALDDAGFKTGDGGLQFSLRDQSSSGQNNGNESSRHAQRLVISDEDTIPATVAGRTYGRLFGSSSGVDIRV